MAEVVYLFHTDYLNDPTGQRYYAGPHLVRVLDVSIQDRINSLPAGHVTNITALTDVPGQISDLAALSSAASAHYLTRADMDADTGQDDGTLALVFNDSTANNNGLYVSVSGAWSATSLQLANANDLTAKADSARTVSGGGLATGGGDLTGDRTITVTEASEVEAQAGTASDVVLTPRRGTDLVDARRGAVNGIASLDSNGKIPVSELPETAVGALQYQGVWDASTNTPPIPPAAQANIGFYYKVSVAGGTNIDGISDWAVGDWIISDGSSWGKIDNTETVTSVAGRAGNVVLDKADVGLGSVDNVADSDKPVSSPQQSALDGKADSVRTVSGGGLATGGGDLSADRTITVLAASEAETLAEQAGDRAVTPQGLGVVTGLLRKATLDAAPRQATPIFPPGNGSGSLHLVGNRFVHEVPGESERAAASFAAGDLDAFGRYVTDEPTEAVPPGWPDVTAEVAEAVPAAWPDVTADFAEVEPASWKTVAEKWVTGDGDLRAQRLDDGLFSQPVRTNYAAPAMHMVNGRAQMAAFVPSRGGRFTDPWPILFSGQGSTFSACLEYVAGDVYAFLTPGGQTGFVKLPSVVKTANNSTDMHCLYFDGQSLSTARAGDSSGEYWSIPLEYDGAIDGRIQSFSQIDLVVASDGEPNNITIQTEAFQPARDSASGNASLGDGGFTRSSSPMLAAAATRALTATGLTDGEQLFVAAGGSGGKSIDFFLAAEDGGDGLHYSGTWEPMLNRLHSQIQTAGYTPKGFYNSWFQGEADLDLTWAEYLTRLNQLAARRRTDVESALGASARYRMISYQCGRVISSSPPSDASVGDLGRPGMAQGAKTISNASEDAYFTAFPYYWLTFSSVSHLDAQGYEQLFAIVGLIANEWDRLDAETGEKFKWGHVIPEGAKLFDGDRKLWLPIHRPFGGRVEIFVPETPSPWVGIPEKTDYGLTFSSDTSVPDRTSIDVSPCGTAVVVTFASPWTDTGRTVGVAADNDGGSVNPGWHTASGQDDDLWIHDCAGTNIRVRMPWTTPITGRPIAGYLMHQIIEIH